MRIGLSPVKGLDVAELGLDLHNLTNARFYRTVHSRKINAGESEYAIVEYDDGSLAPPDSDPLVIGLLYCKAGSVVKSQDLIDGDYVPHAVWNDRVWSILDQDALSLISLLTGVTVEDLQTAEQVLNESQGQPTHESDQLPDSGGPEDSST